MLIYFVGVYRVGILFSAPRQICLDYESFVTLFLYCNSLHNMDEGRSAPVMRDLHLQLNMADLPSLKMFQPTIVWLPN
jgi:hypothetical protein